MNLKDVIRKTAPALAHLLGGPAAEVVVKEIAGAVLGKEDAKEDEIAAAILTGSPEMFVKLKELELTHAARLAELGVKYEEIDAADRASARAREIAVKDRIPAILAISSTGAFLGLVYLLIAKETPSGNRDAINLLIGGLGGQVYTIITYYFGSSRGSSAKDETIRSAVGKG